MMRQFYEVAEAFAALFILVAALWLAMALVR